MNRRRHYLPLGLSSIALILLVACSSSGPPTPAPVPTSTPPPKPSPSATAPTPASKTTVATAPATVSFAGKTITIVVPSAAGGAADLTARVYSKWLPRFLPGNPAVVVRNATGGGGTIGANYVYKSAKPDGLTTLILASSGKLNELLGAGGVEYRLGEMPAIVGTASGAFVPIRSGIVSKPEDILKAKGVIFGYMAGTAGTAWVCMRELLDFPVEKAVFAFTGSGDTRRAFLAGEVNMVYEATVNYHAVLGPYVQKGEVMVLWESGIIDEKGATVKDPGLPKDIPTVSELYQKLYGKPPSGMKWTAYQKIIADRSFDKILALTPRTPDNITDAYFAAAEKMIKDTTFLKDAEAMVGQGIVWGAGKTYDKNFKANYGLDLEIREWIRKVLSERYGVLIG